MLHHSNGDICRAYFTYNRQSFQVTQFRGGKLEVYRIEDTGLEMFKGYACDIRVIGLALAAYEAFQKVPGQCWLFDANSTN